MSQSTRDTLPRGLCLLLGLGLALRLGLACIDTQFLVRTGLFGDDAFYFLNIARHVARGDGVTHDGIHPTNGIQPLYTFMLVPVFWVWGGSETAPIHAAATLLAVVSTLTGGFLFLLVRRLAGESGGLVALALWLFSPYVIRQTMNGMETGVSAFFLVVSLWWYGTRIRGNDECAPRVRTLVAGGCLLGLAILSRMDNVILAAVMLGDYVWASRAGLRQGVRRAFALGAPAGVVLAGWLAVNLVTSGSLLPVSGRAVRLLTRLYIAAGKDPGVQPGRSPVPIPVRPASTLETWRRTVPWALEAFVNARQWRFAWDRLRRHRAAGACAAAGLFLVALLGGWFSRGVELGNELREAWRRSRAVHWTLLYCLVLVAAYALYVYGNWFYPRYLFPKTIVGTVFVALAYEAVLRAWVKRRRWLRPLAGGAVAVLVGVQFLAGAGYFLKTRQGFANYYEAAQWLNRGSIDPGWRIGAFQSGIIGYFAHRPVIGLDGVVNEEAYRALRRGTLMTYLRTSGIRVLIDDPGVLEVLCATDPTYAQVQLDLKALWFDGFSAYALPWPSRGVAPTAVKAAS